MKYKLLIGLFLIVTNSLYSQKSEQHYFQGFTDEVSGKRFGYHSPFPDVNTSLLLRGQADFKPIEWMSEIVPFNYVEEFVTFIWVFGRDVTANPVTFHLHVNNQQWFTFENSKLSTLGLSEISGKDGSKLSFNVTMLDKYEDQMGFVILKLPTKAIRLGLPTLLKVEAEAAENDAWFMTYKTGVDEKIDINKINETVFKSINKTPDVNTVKLDRIFLHPFWGLLIFLVSMGVIFTSIFWLASPLMNLIDSLFSTLSDNVANILPQDTWYNDLITKGLINGVGAVLLGLRVAFLHHLRITVALVDGLLLADIPAFIAPVTVPSTNCSPGKNHSSGS